jgi:hypothetical protein
MKQQRSTFYVLAEQLEHKIAQQPCYETAATMQHVLGM